MALLDMFKRGAKSAGKNLENYIGGLLGEDLSQLSEEERKQIRRQGMSAVFDAMARGTTPSQGLAGVAQMAGARLEQKRLQGRQKAAEDEMGRITGRLFGGAPAAPADMGEDESGLGTVGIQSQYRQNPQEALARLYGTPAGRDVAQMAPGLLELAQEGVKGRTVGGAVYNPLTGAFSKPPEEKKPVREIDLGNRVRVMYSDGTFEDLRKGLAPGAGAKGEANKPTEGQVRASLLAQGMRDAEQELFNLNPSSVIGRGSGFVPEAFKSGDRKRYESAAKRWAANLLYIKSGAQAGQDEINSTWQQFFPVPGDTQAEIQQKNRARLQELSAVSAMLGGAGFDPDKFQPEFVKSKPANISLDDWMSLTKAERDEWVKESRRGR
jgi:hypothetical protein